MLRYLLLQPRNAGGPMRTQELECFARALSFGARAQVEAGLNLAFARTVGLQAAEARIVMSEKRNRRPRGFMNRLGLLIVAAPMILFAAKVAAEHEANHRYDVRGYVLSADKRPLVGVPVTILKQDQTIGSGRTDGDGYYDIRVHLHDSDIGEALTVRADKHQALIRMRAEYANQTTGRVHHVSFAGGEVSEKTLAGSRIPTWVYLVAAPFVLWAVVYFTEAIRRKIRKLRLAKAPAQPGERKKGRKGKRKR